MMIDKIGGVNPLLYGNNANAGNRVNRPMQADSIKLSEEALQRSELYQVSEMVNSAPDVRTELVAEMKRQISDPAFISGTALDATADKLLAVFGF
jgi:anti-sigma28 factor (negative regulator of flagellin synthesis)